MARRVSLPAADDLFRPTVEPLVDPIAPVLAPGVDPTAASAVEAVVPEEQPKGAAAQKSAKRAPAKRTAGAVERPAVKKATVAPTAAKKPSGRVRHDEKMTVYVTSDELLDIEHARLTLRRANGLAVDRGRIVREAVALVLADFEENGDDSALVKRLLEG